GAGNRGRDLLFGDLSRPDAGGRSGRARVRSLHRGTAVHGDRRRAAGLGLVVRGETPAPDDGGRTAKGEERQTIRRGTHKSGGSRAVAQKATGSQTSGQSESYQETVNQSIGQAGKLDLNACPRVGPCPRERSHTTVGPACYVFHDRRTPSSGRPAWVISAGRKNLKLRRKRS